MRQDGYSIDHSGSALSRVFKRPREFLGVGNFYLFVHCVESWDVLDWCDHSRRDVEVDDLEEKQYENDCDRDPERKQVRFTLLTIATFLIGDFIEAAFIVRYT